MAPLREDAIRRGVSVGQVAVHGLVSIAAPPVAPSADYWLARLLLEGAPVAESFWLAGVIGRLQRGGRVGHRDVQRLDRFRAHLARTALMTATMIFTQAPAAIAATAAINARVG
jgi:hypothetical protein